MGGSNDATLVAHPDRAIPLTRCARVPAPDPLAERLLAMLMSREYRREICTILANMLSAFTQTPADPEKYVRWLASEVLEAKPTPDQLECACRKLVQTKIFLPSVAEVLIAIREAQR